jgi:sec-independent protein translocase protein TatC
MGRLGWQEIAYLLVFAAQVLVSHVILSRALRRRKAGLSEGQSFVTKPLARLGTRLLLILTSIGVAFAVSLTFVNRLWDFVSTPASVTLREMGTGSALVAITPMEPFTTVYLKLPLLTSVFLASSWIAYQVWILIAPSLDDQRRRWASWSVGSSAGGFVLGGLFGYFIVFRRLFVFLLGIGKNASVPPTVSLTAYFDLLANVTLGIGLLFELPVLVFLLEIARIGVESGDSL